MAARTSLQEQRQEVRKKGRQAKREEEKQSEKQKPTINGVAADSSGVAQSQPQPSRAKPTQTASHKSSSSRTSSESASQPTQHSTRTVHSQSARQPVSQSADSANTPTALPSFRGLAHAWIDGSCLNPGSKVKGPRAGLGVHLPHSEYRNWSDTVFGAQTNDWAEAMARSSVLQHVHRSRGLHVSWSHQDGRNQCPCNGKADALATQAAATHPLQPRPRVPLGPGEPLAPSGSRTVWPKGNRAGVDECPSVPAPQQSAGPYEAQGSLWPLCRHET